MPNAPQMFVNIICLGVANTGKSCAVSRFLNQSVSFEGYIPSMAADFGTVTKIVNRQQMILQLWDVAGDSRFRTSQCLIPLTYGRPDIIMLFFDITQLESLNALNAYLTELDEKKIERERIILVGAKSDLVEQRQVSTETARTWATTHGISTYIEVSAKDDPDNLKEQFLQAIGGRLTTITPTPTPAPAAHSQPPVIDVIAQPASSSRSLFCGLFSSVPAHNRYLLTDGDNADPDFSNDFRAIYRHLYTNSWIFHKSTVAKAVLDNNSLLNQTTLSEHGQQNDSSRTKKTLDVWEQLRTIQGEAADSISNMKQFLRNFRTRYNVAFPADARTPPPRSAEAFAWIRHPEFNNLSDDVLKTRTIEVLCYPAINPHSRVAGLIDAARQNSSTLLNPSSKVNVPH